MIIAPHYTDWLFLNICTISLGVYYALRRIKTMYVFKKLEYITMGNWAANIT